MSFAAIGQANNSNKRKRRTNPRRTSPRVNEERIEADLATDYRQAIALQSQANWLSSARIFESILTHDIMKGKSTMSMQLKRIRYLSLKNLAASRMRMNLPSKALECLLLAAEIESDAGILCDIGVLSWRLRKLSLARTCLQRSIMLEPKNFRSLNTLLDVLVAVGDHKAILNIINHCLTLDPDHVKSCVILSALQKAYPTLFKTEPMSHRIKRQRPEDMEREGQQLATAVKRIRKEKTETCEGITRPERPFEAVVPETYRPSIASGIYGEVVVTQIPEKAVPASNPTETKGGDT